MRIHILVVIMVLSATLCGCTKIPDRDYVNKRLGIAFDRPEGWARFYDYSENTTLNRMFGKYQEYQEKGVAIELKKRKESYTNTPQIRISVAMYEKIRDLEEEAEENISIIKEKFPDAKVISRKARIINGLNAYETNIKARDAYLKQVLLHKGRKGVVIVCGAKEDDYDDTKPEFEELIESFEIFK